MREDEFIGTSDRAPESRTKEKTSADGRRLTFDLANPISREDKNERKKLISSTGIDGFCVLGRLYLFDIIWDIGPDMMHIDKNIYQLHLVPLFDGSKNTAPAKPKPLNEVDANGDLYPDDRLKKIREANKRRRRLWQEIQEVYTCRKCSAIAK